MRDKTKPLDNWDPMAYHGPFKATDKTRNKFIKNIEKAAPMRDVMLVLMDIDPEAPGFAFEKLPLEAQRICNARCVTYIQDGMPVVRNPNLH